MGLTAGTSGAQSISLIKADKRASSSSRVPTNMPGASIDKTNLNARGSSHGLGISNYVGGGKAANLIGGTSTFGGGILSGIGNHTTATAEASNIINASRSTKFQPQQHNPNMYTVVSGSLGRSSLHNNNNNGVHVSSLFLIFNL